ncbi:unnamed protein product, partial [Prorocentrum cordatum]
MGHHERPAKSVANISPLLTGASAPLWRGPGAGDGRRQPLGQTRCAPELRGGSHASRAAGGSLLFGCNDAPHSLQQLERGPGCTCGASAPAREIGASHGLRARPHNVLDDDFEEEEDQLFIGADHPAYARVQEALKRQLVRKNEQRTLELRERGEELRKLVKHREEVGVTLYTSQQQLAKLQLQLEQLHDRFAMVRGSAQETEESLKTATVDRVGAEEEG